MADVGCDSCNKLKIEVNELREWMKEWFDVLLGRFDKQDKWFELITHLAGASPEQLRGLKRTAEEANITGASRRKCHRPNKVVNGSAEENSPGPDDGFTYEYKLENGVDHDAANGIELVVENGNGYHRRDSVNSTDDEELESDESDEKRLWDQTHDGGLDEAMKGLEFQADSPDTRSNPEHGSKMHQRRCEICGRWSTVRNMKRHMDMVHGSPMQVQCPICDKTFKWKDTLRRHLKTIHHNELVSMVSASGELSKRGRKKKAELRAKAEPRANASALDLRAHAGPGVTDDESSDTLPTN